MTLEEGLTFNIENKGSITVFTFETGGDHLSEWYIGDKDHHVSADWFYDKLKDNEKGIYLFAAIFDYKTESEQIKQEVERYERRYDESGDDYGFDTAVYMIEEFLQEATGEPDLHWW